MFIYALFVGKNAGAQQTNIFLRRMILNSAHIIAEQHPVLF
jgi:hypothetical protein